MDEDGEEERAAFLEGSVASGFHGVLSYRKQKLLNGLKPGMRTLDLHFRQIIMATEENGWWGLPRGR